MHCCNINKSRRGGDFFLVHLVDIPLDQQLQSDKPKLALGSKAVCASMGMKYKSAGAQSAIVSHRLQ